MRRVIVVERRYVHSDGSSGEWRLWGVYDSIATVREEQAASGRCVGVAPNWRSKWWPWTWTDEYGGEYRADSQRFHRRDSGSIDGGYLLALAVIAAVALVYVAVGLQAAR